MNRKEAMSATYFESIDGIRSGDWHQCDSCNAVYCASPPGATIADVLRERGLSTRWLAVRIGRPFSVVVGLVAGRERLTEDLAAPSRRRQRESACRRAASCCACGRAARTSPWRLVGQGCSDSSGATSALPEDLDNASRNAGGSDREARKQRILRGAGEHSGPVPGSACWEAGEA